MTIAADILPLHIPFRQSFSHARAAGRGHSDAVVVRLTGDDGIIGYGEGLPRPYVTGEDVPGMIAALQDRFIPPLLEAPVAIGMEEVLPQLQELMTARWHRNDDAIAWHATQCAVELALLDAAFKRAGQSLAQWLVPARSQVCYTGVVDASDPATAAATAARYQAAGFTALKVKVGSGDDAQRLAAVRDQVGPESSLRVDANGAWTADQAVRILAGLMAHNITAVEQPVAAADLPGMRRVRQELDLAVIADESLVTLADARRLVDAEACDIFHLRVSKCGGLLASLRMAEYGAASGIRLGLGAQVGETSLLSAAGRHLAAHLPDLQYAEGSFGTHLLTEDITATPVMFDQGGRGGLLTGAGLGVDVDPEALQRYAAHHPPPYPCP